MISCLFDILDMGSKFVPCQHINLQSIFYNLINDFDSQLPKLNRKIFFNKMNQNRNTPSNDNLTMNIVRFGFESRFMY